MTKGSIAAIAAIAGLGAAVWTQLPEIRRALRLQSL
jgi:hypothetical protein